MDGYQIQSVPKAMNGYSALSAYRNTKARLACCVERIVIKRCQEKALAVVDAPHLDVAIVPAINRNAVPGVPLGAPIRGLIPGLRISIESGLNIRGCSADTHTGTAIKTVTSRAGGE